MNHFPLQRTSREQRRSSWESCQWTRNSWIPSRKWKNLSHEHTDSVSTKPLLPVAPTPPPPPPYSPRVPSSSAAASNGRFRRCCESNAFERLATSWPVTVIWGLLSVAVATASLVSLVQPAWFVKEEKRNNRDVEVFMVGAFSFCYRVEYLNDYRCHLYGGLFDFRHYPSGAWHAACLLYSSGCVLLSCCALAAILMTLLPSPIWRRQVALAIGMVQAGAVFLLVMALLVFPIGLGSMFVRHFCGEEATVYSAGSCQLGWAYTLALVAAIIAIYCPILSFFTSYKIYRQRSKISYSQLL